MNNDTINLVVEDSKLYQYIIVNNEILKENSYIEPFRYSWSYDPIILTKPNLTVLYKGEDNLNLFQLFDDGPWTTDTKISADFATSFNLINRSNERVLIYHDNIEKIALNTHNFKSEYSRYYYCNVKSDNLGEIKALNSGRTSIYNLETTSYNDTLYAVWEHSKQKSLLGILVGGWEKSLVFSKYDGNDWSKPITLQDNFDYHGYTKVLGVYKINNTFFCFWSKNSDSESKSYNRKNIFYQSSNDQTNWTEPKKLPGLFKAASSIFWIAENRENEKLHIILNRTENKYSEYCTFDGVNLIHKKQIDKSKISKLQIKFDGIIPYLFFVKKIIPDDFKNYIDTTYYMKLEDGDSSLVHLIDMTPIDENLIENQIQYIKLIE